jgi:hypothetical protein
MKVSVFSNDGGLLWSREITTGPPSVFTSTNYLHDGMQHKIIGALDDALTEARGQLRGFSLDVADVVSDVRATAAKVNRRVPIAIAWNRDAGR